MIVIVVIVVIVVVVIVVVIVVIVVVVIVVIVVIVIVVVMSVMVSLMFLMVQNPSLTQDLKLSDSGHIQTDTHTHTSIIYSRLIFLLEHYNYAILENIFHD